MFVTSYHTTRTVTVRETADSRVLAQARELPPGIVSGGGRIDAFAVALDELVRQHDAGWPEPPPLALLDAMEGRR